MKRLKYLLLIIMLLPITVFADAIHLDQDVFFEAMDNPNYRISSHKIKFFINDYDYGFILYGDEYILDEDIELYRGYITTSSSHVTLNLNGYDLTQDLSLNGYSGGGGALREAIESLYAGSSSYLTKMGRATISNNLNNEDLIDITINGPGKIYNAYDNSYTYAICNYGGNIVLNNVKIQGSILSYGELDESYTTINNNQISGGINMMSKSGSPGSVLVDPSLPGYDYPVVRRGIVQTETHTAFQQEMNAGGSDYDYYDSKIDVVDSTVNLGVEVIKYSEANINNSIVKMGINVEPYSTLNINNSSVYNMIYALAATLNFKNLTMEGYINALMSNTTIEDSNITTETIDYYSSTSDYYGVPFNMYSGVLNIKDTNTSGFEFSNNYFRYAHALITDDGRVPLGTAFAANSFGTIGEPPLGLVVDGLVFGPSIDRDYVNRTILKNKNGNVSITGTKIVSDESGVYIVGGAKVILEDSEVYAKNGIPLGLCEEYDWNEDDERVYEFPELKMADVYLHNDSKDISLPSIMTQHYKNKDLVSNLADDMIPSVHASMTNSETEALYNSFLKENYMYYKDPVFTNNISQQVLEAMYGGIDDDDREYFEEWLDETQFTTLSNPEIWVISSALYFIEEDSLYYIPEDNEVTVVLQGDERLLETIEINGQILAPDEYEVIVIDNKTVGIKINQDYLRGLDVGDYKVKVTFVNGEAESKLNVKDGDPNKPDKDKEDVKGEVENPKTGLFNYLLLLIPLTIAGIIYIKVRKNTVYKSI